MTPAPVKAPISIEVFNQIDIRAGTIESVADVAGSDKLVALHVNFGDHTRTIVAGLKQERANRLCHRANEDGSRKRLQRGCSDRSQRR